MKRLLPLALLIASCSAGSTADTPASSSCPELSFPVFSTSGAQQRMYYTVSGFDPQKKECWQMLREAAKKQDGPVVVAFIDSDDFTPGKDGVYDRDDAIREKVVAQALVNKELDLFEFSPDPFGFGKYKEPK